MKTYQIILFSLFFSTFCSAQDAGVRAYAGVTSAKNRVAAITPENTSHNGYHIGADGRLNSGRMFFVVGLRYTSIDLLASADSEFFSSDPAHSIISGRAGLGWHLVEFGHNQSIRAKLLAQLDSNLNYDEAFLEEPYGMIVGASAGATAGIGVQFKFLTLDLEYEYGLVNQFSQQKETKVDSYSLSLGFFF